MRLKNLLFALAASVVFSFTMLTIPGKALARYRDGNELYRQLQATQRCNSGKIDDCVQRWIGTAYVAGVVDSLDVGTKNARFCIPAGVTVEQVTAVTFQFLEKHPENRHLNAAMLVSTALSEKFPCTKK